MLRFWRNPEFLRHAWAEMRAQRVITVTAVEALVIFLFWLSVKSSSPKSMRWADFFESLTNLQFIGLAVWVCYSCGQAIARERLMKTYDFLVTTRLSAGELVLGKLIGEPLLGYFAVLISIPISFAVGLVAGNSVLALTQLCLVLIVMGLVFGLMALWISMLVESISAGGLALLAALITLSFVDFQTSTFRGFAGLSPAATVSALLAPNGLFHRTGGWEKATLFGVTVSYSTCFFLVYLIAGSFLYLMLSQNLKRDTQNMQMLSRRQALSLMILLSLLFYAFFDPQSLHELARFHTTPADMFVDAAGYSAALVYLLGLLTLSPLETSKRWWRSRKSSQDLLSSDGPASMWLLVATGCTFLMLLAAAWWLRSTGTWTSFYIETAGLQFALIAIFAIRDILFLQWCLLTGMKFPFVKGILYLALYYFAASIIVAAARQASVQAATFTIGLLTAFVPFSMFSTGSWSGLSSGVMAGLPLQFGAIVILWLAIRSRLSRPVKLPVPQVA